MWFLKWRPNANREQMGDRHLALSNRFVGEQTTFKLLRKKKAVYANGTTD